MVVDPKPIVATTYDLHLVAVNDGTISVEAPLTNEIDASLIRTYTGELVDGKNVSESTVMGPLPGKSVKVKAGQEYFVRFVLHGQKVGKFKRDIVIKENLHSVVAHVSGEVLPNTSAATIEVGLPTVVSSANRYVTGLFNVTYNGKGKGTVQLWANSTLPGVTAQIPSSVSFDKAGQKPVSYTFYVPKETPDQDVAINWVAKVKESGITATASTVVQVRTIWSVWQDYTLSKGDVSMKGTFRWANSGYWDWTVYAKTDSVYMTDFADLMVWIDKPLPDGSKLGMSTSFGLDGNYNIGDSEKNRFKSGYSSDLQKMGDSFNFAHTKARLAVNVAGAISNWETSYMIKYL